MVQLAAIEKAFRLFLIIVISSLSFSMAQGQSTFFILDGSGSMWGKIGDETKIQIAKRVLKDAVKNSAMDDNPGLVVYGHRVKPDCDDIEMMLAPKTSSLDEFNKKIDEINPVGKTPLAGSATLVIEYLEENPSATNIILITDGIETCDGDLCEVIRKAKEAGIEFVLHIVGFGLEGEDLQPLECAAQEGGGRYLDADDEKGLASALESVQELSVEDVTPRLSVECIKDGELVDGLIIVQDAVTKQEVTRVRSYTSEETNPALVGLPYGKFDVIVSITGSPGIPAVILSDIVIDVDTVRNEKVDFTAGTVSITASDNGELHDATINVYSQDSGERVEGGRTYTLSKSNPWIEDLYPGNYRAIVKSVPIKGVDISKEILFRIEAGKSNTLNVEFQSGFLNLGVQKAGQLMDATVQVIYQSTSSAVAQGRTYTSPSSNPKQFRLSAGIYDIKVKPVKAPKAETKTITLEVLPGKTRDYTVILD